MDKQSAQAIAALICRVIDYWKVAEPDYAISPYKGLMAQAEQGIADALEAIPDEPRSVS